MENMFSVEGLRSFLKTRLILVFEGILAVLFIYGPKIFNISIGIDADIFLDGTERNRTIWLASGRFGLVLMQYIFKHFGTNVCADTFLACCLLLASGIICAYMLYRANNGIDTMYLSLFLIFYLSSPIWVESIYFSFQAAEVMMTVALSPVLVCLLFNWLEDKKYKTFGIAFLIMFIISIYQASLLIFIAEFFAVVLLLTTGESAIDESQVKKAFENVILVTVAGTVLYFIIKKLVQIVMNQQFVYLETMVHIGKEDYFPRFGALLFELFGADIPILNTMVLEKVTALAGSSITEKIIWNSNVASFLHLPAFVIFLFVVLKKFSNGRGKSKAFQLLSGVFVILSVFPLAILGGNVEIRALFSFAFVSAFVLLFILLNTSGKRLVYVFEMIIIAALYIQVQRSALMITSDQLRYQSDVALTNSIMTQIYEQCDSGYEIKLYISGRKSLDIKDNYKAGRVIGHSIYDWSNTTFGAVSFMHDLGYTNVQLATVSPEIQETINNMPIYPAKGSITKVEDVWVVKLSE